MKLPRFARRANSGASKQALNMGRRIHPSLALTAQKTTMSKSSFPKCISVVILLDQPGYPEFPEETNR